MYSLRNHIQGHDSSHHGIHQKLKYKLNKRCGYGMHYTSNGYRLYEFHCSLLLPQPSLQPSKAFWHIVGQKNFVENLLGHCPCHVHTEHAQSVKRTGQRMNASSETFNPSISSEHALDTSSPKPLKLNLLSKVSAASQTAVARV